MFILFIHCRSMFTMIRFADIYSEKSKVISNVKIILKVKFLAGKKFSVLCSLKYRYINILFM